jgi:hypothetical protein
MRVKKGGGGEAQQINGLLFAIDQQAGVGTVDGNQAAVLVAGCMEPFAGSSHDLFVLIFDDCLERTCEASCGRTNNSVLSITYIAFFKRHIVLFLLAEVYGAGSGIHHSQAFDEQ